MTWSWSPARRRVLTHPWYHDFAVLGRPTSQAEGIFRQNQEAKQDVLFDLIRHGVALCPVTSEGPRGVELFCADGLYSHYALNVGASHMTGLDLGLAQNAGDPIHLQQARAMTSLLGHRGRAEFLAQDVFTLQGSFDLTICAGGLYHLEDPEALLRDMHRYTRAALVLQTVYSLAYDEPTYFEAPAPGWSWGCRFSEAWLLDALSRTGWKVLTRSHNVLEGNTRPDDRGSVYALAIPA